MRPQWRFVDPQSTALQETMTSENLYRVTVAMHRHYLIYDFSYQLACSVYAENEVHAKDKVINRIQEYGDGLGIAPMVDPKDISYHVDEIISVVRQ